MPYSDVPGLLMIPGFSATVLHRLCSLIGHSCFGGLNDVVVVSALFLLLRNMLYYVLCYSNVCLSSRLLGSLCFCALFCVAFLAAADLFWFRFVSFSFLLLAKIWDGLLAY